MDATYQEAEQFHVCFIKMKVNPINLSIVTPQESETITSAKISMIFF